MSEPIRLDDYKKSDGSIDWPRYRSAKVASGEECAKCGHFIMFPKGHRALCGECEELANDAGEISHSQFVRCPECRHTWDPYESEDYKLLADGEHEVQCDRCDRKFEVSTDVSYTFTSPPLNASGDDAETA